MKKIGLAFCLMLLAAAGAFAQTFDFTLINDTGYTIDEVYVSPADDNKWGDDVLGRDWLEDGEYVDIEFNGIYELILLAFGVDKYDLKCVYEDGSEDEWYDLKLETISEITLSLDKRGNGVATFE